MMVTGYAQIKSKIIAVVQLCRLATHIVCLNYTLSFFSSCANINFSWRIKCNKCGKGMYYKYGGLV